MRALLAWEEQTLHRLKGEQQEQQKKGNKHKVEPGTSGRHQDEEEVGPLYPCFLGVGHFYEMEAVFLKEQKSDNF